MKRVYELARELKISSGALRNILRDLSFETKTHMVVVPDDLEKKVRALFRAEAQSVKEQDTRRQKLHSTPEDKQENAQSQERASRAPGGGRPRRVRRKNWQGKPATEEKKEIKLVDVAAKVERSSSGPNKRRYDNKPFNPDQKRPPRGDGRKRDFDKKDERSDRPRPPKPRVEKGPKPAVEIDLEQLEQIAKKKRVPKEKHEVVKKVDRLEKDVSKKPTKTKTQEKMRVRLDSSGEEIIIAPKKKKSKDEAIIVKEKVTVKKIGKGFKKRTLKHVDQTLVKENVRKTLAQMATKRKKVKRNKIDQKQQDQTNENILRVNEFTTVAELSKLLGITSTQLIAKLMGLGVMGTINQRLERDIIEMICEEFGKEAEFVEEYGTEIIESEITEEEADEDASFPRAPIVTIMGHVDHGKTSLLDYIRETNVIAGEAGGITQHIGAYMVETDNGSVTFLDTPGHEAFTAMRARGTQVTDLAVIVVAADDGVMPQTIEAIEHARLADVPIIIAINKIDKPTANIDKVKSELTKHNLLVEDLGGNIVSIPVSAKTGEGIDHLLEMILLEAEMLQLIANPKKAASGIVLESRLDKGLGAVASVLIEDGSVKVGDHFVMGPYFGRVRAILDERSKHINEAGPSYAIQILGSNGLPSAGDSFNVLKDDKLARQIAQKRQQLKREQDMRLTARRHIHLHDVFSQIQEGELKELNLIVKADMDGSAEAVADSLEKLTNDEVGVRIIRRGVGGITDADVLLAAASEAVIVGFNVRADSKAKLKAQEEGVDIHTYSIIYNLIEEVKGAMLGMMKPIIKQEFLGAVEVRDVFKITKVGAVAGCYVTEGKIIRNGNIRLYRENINIYSGELDTLKRFKDDVKEVKSGYECGVKIKNFDDIKVGDVIECYVETEVKRSMDDK